MPDQPHPTLQELERRLKRHIHELMALDCQDAVAADAITFAVRRAEEALRHTHAARREERD